MLELFKKQNGLESGEKLLALRFSNKLANQMALSAEEKSKLSEILNKLEINYKLFSE